jgi:hypothetical protein
VFLEFPTIAGKRNKAAAWQLREDYVAELVESFPGVSVRQESRAALTWIHANAPKRKTADGMPEFLFRWMRREQNGGRYPNNGAKDGRNPGRSLQENLTV